MQKLVQGLHRFQSEVFSPRHDFFTNLARGQHPEALFITCSDSRVAPNLITQTDPGDLFILRNAGNIIPRHDGGPACGETATIEFAVEHLEVSSIVVCGHTCCGAMRALLQPPEALEGLPAVTSWLDHAAATRRNVLERYADRDPSTLATLMVEENVLTQIENLHTHPSVVRRLTAGKLSIYAWVYKIETGEVFQYDTRTGQYEELGADARPTNAPRGRGADAARV
jgi:carbonic anhydrase